MPCRNSPLRCRTPRCGPLQNNPEFMSAASTAVFREFSGPCFPAAKPLNRFSRTWIRNAKRNVLYVCRPLSGKHKKTILCDLCVSAVIKLLALNNKCLANYCRISNHRQGDTDPAVAPAAPVPSGPEIFQHHGRPPATPLRPHRARHCHLPGWY